jgi:hypothetical protein
LCNESARAILSYGIVESAKETTRGYWVMREAVNETQCQVQDHTGEQLSRLDWIPVYVEPSFLWKPPGLEAADLGWFVNLLEASLRSEWQGYLVVDDPETLWRIAGAKHPETWRRHCSKVLAHFDRDQMHGRQVLYFPPLVRTINEQQKKRRGKRSRFPKNQQESECGAGFSLPLAFDSVVDVGSKTKKDGCVNMESEPKPSGYTLDEHRQSSRRILEMLGLPATDGNLRAIEAAVIAEAAYTGQSSQEAAELIAKAAIEDRNNGIVINKFYFEDAKWRQSGVQNVRSRLNKAEQRKLDNLEANERAKQRLRQRVHGS